jgi:hypothetical protein
VALRGDAGDSLDPIIVASHGRPLLASGELAASGHLWCVQRDAAGEPTVRDRSARLGTRVANSGELARRLRTTSGRTHESLPSFERTTCDAGKAREWRLFAQPIFMASPRERIHCCCDPMNAASNA